jgi:dCMP deaminase
MSHWDHKYLGLAQFVSSWSKDPRKRVGAVVTKENKVKGLGFNGFPNSIDDTKERLADRKFKNKLMVHAEVNALLASNVEGDTIYVWPVLPCTQCLGLIIQSGIRRIVVPELDNSKASSWDPSLVLQLIDEADLEITFIEI